MSWKPSRSSGIMFDTFTQKAVKAKTDIEEMLQSGNYLRFEYQNRLSKAFYLWWLNDNKASKAMYSKTERSFRLYCEDYFIRMFKNDMAKDENLIYKPLRPILQSIKI